MLLGEYPRMFSSENIRGKTESTFAEQTTATTSVALTARSVCALSQHDDIFGERNWTHVQKAVRKNIYSKWWWRRVPKEDLDDSIQAAMVDLIDYWLSLESSVSGDPDRNFKYAVWRATKEASKFLVGIFQDRTHEVSIDGVNDDDEERGSLWDRIADTEEGPEDLACETDELSRARRLIEDAEPGEMDGWLHDLLSGISESESARRTGIARQVMHRRREAGVRRIALKACAYGLR